MSEYSTFTFTAVILIAVIYNNTALSSCVQCGGIQTFNENFFRCDYTYSEEASGWFKFYMMPTTWHAAQLRCRLQGATLASPTADILAPLLNIVRNQSVTKVYTGINAVNASGYFNTIEGVPIEDCSVPKHWDKGEPNNLSGKEDCITLNSEGLLADEECDLLLPYICFKRKTCSSNILTGMCGPTNNGYSYEERTHSCYKVHNVPRSYVEAYTTCQAEGGYLAIINSETESKVIIDIIDKYPTDEIYGDHSKIFYHIGFYREWNRFGDLITIHGQTLEEAGFNKFDSSSLQREVENVENCGGVVRGSGSLFVASCDEMNGFICEIEPKLCNNTECPLSNFRQEIPLEIVVHDERLNEI